MKNEYPKPIRVGARQDQPGVANANCPIFLETRGVLDTAVDLYRVIRKLRRSTQLCQTCPERAECPLLANFAEAVDQAIREVRQEWGL